MQTPTFITIVVSLKPVFDVPPTPAYGIELATQPGTPFQFTIQASDLDPLDLVRLTDVLNKPVNAVLSPSTCHQHATGARASTARTRRQSSPQNIASNCA